MLLSKSRSSIIVSFAGLICTVLACQKTTTAPSLSGVAAFTVVNTVPTSLNIIPVINTSDSIMWFKSANQIGYGMFYEYSPTSGKDTVYVVQSGDTLLMGPKATGQMFYDILPLKTGGIYSLYLCGTDTSSPDYLFTIDTLPYHSPSDSVMGIRYVNLSAGSDPISINLEGSPNGSEVANLPYKDITDFKNYACNSTVGNYLFVVRDAITGDSLTCFSFNGNNNGYGLLDINNGNLLTFKNITIAVYGSEINMNFPLNTMLIDDY